MPRMTDEEADALDELWTKTTPEIDTTKPGFFTSRMAHFVEVDALTASFLHAKANATHQTPAEILGGLVRKELAATA